MVFIGPPLFSTVEDWGLVNFLMSAVLMHICMLLYQIYLSRCGNQYQANDLFTNKVCPVSLGSVFSKINQLPKSSAMNMSLIVFRTFFFQQLSCYIRSWYDYLWFLCLIVHETTSNFEKYHKVFTSLHMKLQPCCGSCQALISKQELSCYLTTLLKHHVFVTWYIWHTLEICHNGTVFAGIGPMLALLDLS